MGQVCSRCGAEVDEDLVVGIDELVKGCVPICGACIEKALLKTLDELGCPIILDEEEGCVWIPKVRNN